MSDRSTSLCLTLSATSAALISSPTTTIALTQPLIVGSCKSSTPWTPSCSEDLSPSSISTHTDGFRCTSARTTASTTATATVPTSTDSSRNTTTKSLAIHFKDERNDCKGASSEHTTTWALSVTSPVAHLSITPQLFKCTSATSAFSTISASCSQTKALFDSSLSGTDNLLPPMPFLALTSEEVMVRLLCSDGTAESELGSPSAKISTLFMLDEMRDPPTFTSVASSALATFPPPSLVPPSSGPLHPVIPSYSPTESLFNLADRSSQLGQMPARMISKANSKAKSEDNDDDDDNNQDDSRRTVSDDAVIAAIQQYLGGFWEGDQDASKLKNTSLEGSSEITVSHPQEVADMHPGEKNSVLDDLIEPLQKSSAEATTLSTMTIKLNLGTIPAPGKLDGEADIKHPDIEEASSTRRPPWHKPTPDEASYKEREGVLASFTVKQQEECNTATTQTACPFPPGKARRSPHSSPDQRLQHKLEQPNFEGEDLGTQVAHSQIQESSDLRNPYGRTLKCNATYPEVIAGITPEERSKGPSNPARSSKKTLIVEHDQVHDIVVSRIVRLGSSRRVVKSPRLGPDRRLRNLSEQLDIKRERDKKHLSFQDASNLIDRLRKTARDNEALARKRNRYRSSENNKSSHSRKPSSNSAWIQPNVRDILSGQASGEKTQISIRIHKRVNEGGSQISQNEEYLRTGNNAISIRDQVEGVNVHQPNHNGKHPNLGNSTVHERTQGDTGASQADMEFPLRKHHQDFNISSDANRHKHTGNQASARVPIPKPVQVACLGQSLYPLSSIGKRTLDDLTPSVSHKKARHAFRGGL